MLSSDVAFQAQVCYTLLIERNVYSIFKTEEVFTVFSAFPHTFMSLISLLFSFLFASVNTLTSPFALSAKEVNTPDDFTPVVRFAVCSDVHIEDAGDELRISRFEDMIETSYKIAESDSSYNKLDAVCVCGDFTNSGTEEQFKTFRSILDEHIREGTETVTVLGNHEFHNDKSQTYSLYRKYVADAVDTDTVINGFHFIGVSYGEDGSFASHPEKQTWLYSKLSAAKAENSDYPIFVFQHPHPFATVYGSINWGEVSLNSVYSMFPQVVNFSGHSHYPINDPRSIWQGSFTALGTGTLNYFELENELSGGHFPEGNEKAAQFYIVEADKSGSVRVRGYDLISHSFIGTADYYIKTPADKTSFPYTYARRMYTSLAPVFTKDAKISAEQNESGEYLISFPAANDGDGIVHDYKIIITAENSFIPVYSGSYISDYYLIPSSKEYSVNVGALKLDSGKTYKVEVIASNAYYQLSQSLTGEFTASQPQVSQ